MLCQGAEVIGRGSLVYVRSLTGLEWLGQVLDQGEWADGPHYLVEGYPWKFSRRPTSIPRLLWTTAQYLEHVADDVRREA